MLPVVAESKIYSHVYHILVLDDEKDLIDRRNEVYSREGCEKASTQAFSTSPLFFSNYQFSFSYKGIRSF